MSRSQDRLAREIGVPPGSCRTWAPGRINQIVKGQRAISADTAVELGRHFGNGPRFWLGLQIDCGLEETARRLDVACCQRPGGAHGLWRSVNFLA